VEAFVKDTGIWMKHKAEKLQLLGVGVDLTKIPKFL